MSIHWGGRGAGHINRLPRAIGALSPFSGATMLLDFTNPVLDPRITFSRGTNATLVDSTGRITYAPANLLTYSQDFANAAWTKSSCTVTANQGTAPDGTNTLTLLQFSAQFGRLQQGSVSAGVTYIFSIWCRVATGTRVYSIYDAIGNPLGSFTATTTLTRYSVAFTAPATTTLYAVQDRNAGPFVDTFIWGAQLEQVTYQTTPGTYNLTTSALYYGPRFDYDPVTLAPRGLLIEEARTNLTTYSEQFDNAAWLKGNATVTANVTMSPDGTTNADMITQTAASPVVYQSRTLTAAPYTASVRFKQGTAAGFELVFGIALLVLGVRLTYTFATNTTVVTLGGAPTGVSTSVTPIGNGWYEARITVTATAATWFFDVHPVGSNGQTVYVYGAQLEAGAFATSYIPTVASTVSRSGDFPTMTGTNFSSWYNQSEGTFIASCSMLALNTVSTQELLALDDGTAANLIFVRANNTSGSTSSTASTASVSQGFIDIAGAAAGVLQNIAYAIKLNDAALVRNGGTVTTDTTYAVPVGLNRMAIGARLTNFAQLNGHIRAIAYYNTRLPNTQLQTLTAPSLASPLALDFISPTYTVGY